jgi:hypothetical protein
MIEGNNQQTYLSYAELFAHAAQRCLKAETALRAQIGKAEGPYAQAVELIAEAEHGLAKGLSAYASDGPVNTISTRLQYKPEEDAMPPPATLRQALDNITRVNEELAEVFLERADREAPESLRDRVDTVRQEIKGVNKRISMIRLTAEDV